jgi:uncharacterized protein YrrD
MFKGSDVIGKPIVTYSTGSVIKKIKDIVFDANTNAILAMLVDEEGIFDSARVIPFASIKSIGADVITIENEEAIIKAESDENIKRVMDGGNILYGKKVMTEDGRDLGKIVDLYFNEQSGTVEGYEVSGGIFGDAYEGRSFVPAPKALKIGQDVAFFPNEVADLLEQQVGGMKGVFKRAQTGTSEIKEKASEKFNQAGQAVSQKASEMGQTFSSALAQQKGNALEEIKGRRVGRDVRSESGSLIAAEGQIVSDRVLNEAKQYHKETELLAAVTENEAAGLQAQAKHGLNNTGEKVQAGVGQIKEKAQSAWASIREKAAGVKEQAMQKAEERQIKEALGRPVTRVIFDRQDNIILNTGDLVTNEAIARARQENMLDALLSSVSTDKPEFRTQDLKARPEGV